MKYLNNNIKVMNMYIHMPNHELYIKEIVLSTIVAGIISYYYFFNKPNSPSPTIQNVHCEPNYCR
jgi:hypothetical protein